MTEPESRSFTAVVHGIVGNVENLVQAELQLAKAELVQAAHQGARAGRLLGAGAALGQLALGFVMFAAVTALATRIPLWAAALIVGALFAAAVLGGSRSRREAAGARRPEAEPRSRKASGSWDRLQGALGAVASAAALDLLHEAVPGLKQRLTDPVREHLARTPASSAPAFSGLGAPPLPHSNGFNSPDVA